VDFNEDNRMNYLSVAAEECAALGRDQQVVESFVSRTWLLKQLELAHAAVHH
jgi:hypothetical protein